MKSRRHDVRNADAGLRLAFEIASVEDDEIRGPIRRIDDETEQPTLVLFRPRMSRHEHEFARVSVLPEGTELARMFFQVVFVQARSEEPAGHGHRVREAIRLAHAAFIRARKLLRSWIDHPCFRHTGDGVTWNLGAFYNRYQNYIFIAPTGEIDDEEGLPVVAYHQEGADLYGLETELGLPVPAVTKGDLTVRFSGDYLRGKVRGGTDLPAMPPYRLGVALDYDLDRLHLGFETTHNGAQNRVTVGELPTDSFTLVSLDGSYRWALARGSLFAFVRGENLLR